MIQTFGVSDKGIALYSVGESEGARRLWRREGDGLVGDVRLLPKGQWVSRKGRPEDL